MSAYDIVIAGAGPVGCVIAERCASQLNWEVLLLDKRTHIAGNCFDRVHDSGVMIHQYGPHYFRTNSDALLSYLSRFTEWVDGKYFVTSFARGQLFPFPINLLTLARFYCRKKLTPAEGEALLASVREPFDQPSNSEEFVLSRVGRELYEAFYLEYTLKQWGLHPRELAPSVCGRIPVRFNEDCRYVDHKHQCMPKEGFSALFTRMTDHPKIEIRLGTDFRDLKESAPVTVYTGPLDEYFGCCYGPLPWRSLAFDFRLVEKEFVQPNVQINYPNKEPYTRTVEIKHVTRQAHPHTVLCYEYPRADGDPFYPIPTKSSYDLYERYRAMAVKEAEDKQVYFCGRLAEYKYFNTDEVIERALHTFRQIRQRHASS